MLLFTTHSDVAFTNNRAERDLRMSTDPDLTGLNDERRPAVPIHEARTLIVAGVGTGKQRSTHGIYLRADSRDCESCSSVPPRPRIVSTTSMG